MDTTHKHQIHANVENDRFLKIHSPKVIYNTTQNHAQLLGMRQITKNNRR